MLELSLAEIARLLGGQLRGPDGMIRGLSIDSRSLPANALFVALQGNSCDGHEFVSAAAEAGAGGALVERFVGSSLAQIRVERPALAMGRLASAWRDRFALPVLAVTGSNGKTTVKEMVAAILGTAAPTLSTRGNLNNELGVPLTLAGLGSQHRYAIIEMGANHAGEIAYLAGLARPRIAIITNAGAAHLEGFGSLQGVVEAKGEILDGLPDDGVAVLNADDAAFDQWSERVPRGRFVSFGFSSRADVRGHEATDEQVFIEAESRRWPLQLQLSGRHNVSNALAAFAACRAAGIEASSILEALKAMRPVGGRMAPVVGIGGCRIIDDAYNANPGSLQAALDWLAGQPGHRVLVLGEMAELGADSSQWHARIGRSAKAARIDRVFAIGADSTETVSAFGAGAQHFESAAELIDALRDAVDSDTTVLIKGSRRMGMEQVVDALRQQPGECT